ncbi:sensor histidine kinase [Mucilaginibacter sp. KACC 22063]|uniref:sensor histidine kinase n=1 Tax=Mucilaginibacter sp. KACC 22063 TaxID=3025666 RepID=UPI0023671207|nr:histidine kinase [Mucilaginibacter sp. KACC 22063]WDF56030.1 histidine kinase [Mucilaginibacter sp. KACC 22063]
MSKQTNQITAILSGTNSRRSTTVIIHIAFWLLIFKWFLFQAQWVTGDSHPTATYLIGLQKYIIILACFYGVSFALKTKQDAIHTAFYVSLILLFTLTIYGISAYYLYNYINHTQDMPPYYRRFVKNISQYGAWTFVKDYNVLYFHFEQLGLALFPALTIKIFRVAFKSRLEKLKLEKDNLTLELNFLRSQINPHFLFNTLNSVYSLIEDKDETAASMVFALSSMMRYALYDSNASEIDASKELYFIKNYIDIQNIRHSNRLSIELNIADDLDVVKVPSLLLINFVENAFKHGVDKMVKDSWIKINAWIDDTKAFCFEVTNLKPAANLRKSVGGIGVSNTRRRLDLLYPNRHTLEISEDEKIYNVLLKIW